MPGGMVPSLLRATTNTLAGSAFDSKFWGQNWGIGVYLSSGVVNSQANVGGFFGFGMYRSGVTCKTQFSANGSYVEATLNSANSDDRGALLVVGLDSPTANTKWMALVVRDGGAWITPWNNNNVNIGTQYDSSGPVATKYRFQVQKVGSNYVYTGYRGSTKVVDYTDTNGATYGVPGQYVGIGSSNIQNNFNNFPATNGWVGTVRCGDVST